MKKLIYIIVILFLVGCNQGQVDNRALDPTPSSDLIFPATTSNLPREPYSIPKMLTPTIKPPILTIEAKVKDRPLKPQLATSVVVPKLWETVVGDLFEKYSSPYAIEEGADNSVWILYENALIHYIKNIHVAYEFKDISECNKCTSRGTMSVMATGEVWVGLSNGVARLRGDQFEYFSFESILPQVENLQGLRVLTTTQEGTVWASDYDGNLCTLRKKWDCFQPVPDELYDEIISAVSVNENHVWFGTKLGRLIEYQNKKLQVYLLDDLFPTLAGRGMEQLAYDKKSGSLWVLRPGAERCMEGTEYPTIGVIQRKSDGRWNVFETKLFNRSIYEVCDRGAGLSSMSIDSSGRVWIGMIDGHKLVFFDGTNWKTLSGQQLPNFSDSVDAPYPLPFDYILDLYVSKSGDLFVLDLYGVYRFKDFTEILFGT